MGAQVLSAQRDLEAPGHSSLTSEVLPHGITGLWEKMWRVGYPVASSSMSLLGRSPEEETTLRFKPRRPSLFSEEMVHVSSMAVVAAVTVTVPHKCLP